MKRDYQPDAARFRPVTRLWEMPAMGNVSNEECHCAWMPATIREFDENSWDFTFSGSSARPRTHCLAPRANLAILHQSELLKGIGGKQCGDVLLALAAKHQQCTRWALGVGAG